jgi:UDP-N-acetylmuramoyl-tripeptide--D-alanyl-D-alanine ligase
MLRPDVGLITLIARAHSAGLGSLEAIAKEKTALFDELAAVAIGNADDALVSSALAHCDAMQRLRYGESRDAQYRIVGRELVSPETSRVTLARADGGEVSVEIPLLGRAGALACAAAVATVEVLTGASLSAAAIRNGLARVQGAGRLHPRRAPSGLWVIDDSYNANPASCRSSIETAKEIAEVTGGRLVLVLGEMRELGDASVAAHRELGDLVAASGAAWVIAVGGDARYLATRAAELGVDSHFCDVSAAAAELASELVHESDVVLVKGSRGVETERVVDTLMGEGRGGAGRMGPANHHAGVAS